ncbi:hypothetical protein [Aureimonas altamirensis]|uniref:hypothetical protein n=1 Tax=Aureimonas altamirensis TaxID=370622 RepID=UPI0030176F5D
MTDNLPNSQVQEAARWLASQTNPPHPVIPALRTRFNLSALHAVQAIREAQLIRGRSH